MTYTPTYRSWWDMRQRCSNPKNTHFKHYGGRGITVCERWKKFDNFLADMGEAPPDLEIDRKNNDGNYEPDNCRWATRSQQMKNIRPRQRDWSGRFMAKQTAAVAQDRE